MVEQLIERETIISYNDFETMASVYTHDRLLQQHIQKELGIKPWRVLGQAREYEVPKAWLKWPHKPSEKRREASRKAALDRGGVNVRKDRKEVAVAP